MAAPGASYRRCPDAGSRIAPRTDSTLVRFASAWRGHRSLIFCSTPRRPQRSRLRTFLGQNRRPRRQEMRRFAPSVFASQPIEGISERYSFLPTSSILNGMRTNGWVPVRAQEQSIRTEARRGFQKHVVRFARGEHLQTWEKNQVRPEVVLVNSHDKSSAYQLHCGLFRLVCTNGMVVSDGTFQRISIKHSGFNPDSVIERFFQSPQCCL
jgi:Domain of unknown function (DUF932)